MARADLLIAMVRSASEGDLVQFRRSVEAIISEERLNQHQVLADKLFAALQSKPKSLDRPLTLLTSSPMTEERAKGFFIEVYPHKKIGDLIIDEQARLLLDDLFLEHRRRETLNLHNIEPRHRILLTGPPGNGKTSLAEAIANELCLPLLIVQYETIIGSYLGETASRLKRLFDYVKTQPCVLFFDEFDAIGKERGDEHETGEIKRVVSTLLMQIDKLPSTVIVVGASNHSELLDRAAWRRFQIKIEMPRPTTDNIRNWFHLFEMKINAKEIGFKLSADLMKRFEGFNFSELEDFGQNVLRKYILSIPNANMKEIIMIEMKKTTMLNK